jgi:phospholipase C
LREEHVVPTAPFAKDALSGSLPAVSWVVVNSANSEHPPASVCEGENWTVEQLNALVQGPRGGPQRYSSPLTISEVFSITCRRPKVDRYGFGPGVPLSISPYAKKGFVSYTQYEFSSILKFIETRCDLPPLTERDTKANDILDSFRFRQAPLPPLVLEASNCSGPSGVTADPSTAADDGS